MKLIDRIKDLFSGPTKNELRMELNQVKADLSSYMLTCEKLQKELELASTKKRRIKKGEEHND